MARKEPDQSQEFANDINIDKLALDREWLKQAFLLFKYARMSAEAQSIAKRAQEKVKTIRSEIIMQIGKEGINEIAKPTIQQIEAAYRLDKNYIDAKEEQIETEEKAALMEGAVSALWHKRSALERLVELEGRSYWGAPKTPQGLSSPVDRAEERSQGAGNRRLQKQTEQQEEE